MEDAVVKMPAVSIVTTTFNRTEYLRQAIQSALSQTFTDFELLICDDGGLDETKRVCESFRDPRIRHIVNPSKLGIAMNTYHGIQRALSDVIAFLNDDDRWTSSFLERCAAPLLASPATVLVFSDHWLIDSNGKRLLDASEENTRNYREWLAAGPVADRQKLIARLSVPLAMAAVFRKSAVDWSRYTSKVEGAYDSYIAYSLLRGQGASVYIPDRLAEYRVHGGGASAEFHRRTTEGLAHVHGLILRDPSYLTIRNEIRKKYLHLEKHLMKLSIAEFDILSAIKHCMRFTARGLI